MDNPQTGMLRSETEDGVRKSAGRALTGGMSGCL